MISQSSLRGSKGYCVLLSLLVLSAGGCGKPSAGQKEQQDKDFVASLVKTPFVAVIAAMTYYGEFGRWPNSVCDLEALQAEDFEDVDWASLQETVAFEPLPNGAIKIVWMDPHIRFTSTLSAPSVSKENELPEGNP